MSGFRRGGTVTVVPTGTNPLLIPGPTPSGPAAGAIPSPGTAQFITP